MNLQNNIRIGYRWLGTAGIELGINGQSLLIDPYVTRLPWYQMFFQRVQPNLGLVKKIIASGNQILISHAHVDHLLDVPVIVENTGAAVYGSQNTCWLLRRLGVAEAKIHPIEAGDCLFLAPYRVTVFSARHPRVPFFMPGSIPEHWQPPFTARQYRMDSCLSFLIEVGGRQILIESGKRTSPFIPADVLIISPFYNAAYYKRMLSDVHPKWIIPNHWDNFMAPLSLNDRQTYPVDGISSLIARFVLPRFVHTVNEYAPSGRVLIPQLFRTYDLAASTH